MTRAHIVVKGRVQGVCFRALARAEAVRLGVRGWVRNLADGDVEAVAEGEDGAVDGFVAWCRVGSPYGFVSGVEVEFSEPAGEFHGFAIR